HRTNEKTCPCSIARRIGLPGPTKCAWPTNSSSVLGRIRLASGSIGFAIIPHVKPQNRSLHSFHLTIWEYNALDTIHYECRAKAAGRIRRTKKALEAVGTISKRACLWNGSRGLFAIRQLLGLFSA